jgi:hypothetical protein
MRNPNFLIGGTAAGGTSFLATTLIQNPQIYLPARMRPEPHYFFKTWEFEKGFDHYISTWFANVPTQAVAVGERSSSYLYGGARTAARISTALPDVRLIFVLRDPVQRAWANYRYTVLQGLESLPFVDALQQEETRKASEEGVWREIQPHDYSGRSRYATQLRDYMSVFPADNILILKSELLSTDTQSTLNQVHQFLDVSVPKQPYNREPVHHALGVKCAEKQMLCRQFFGARFDQIIEAIRREEDFFSLLQTTADMEWAAILESNLTRHARELPRDAHELLREMLSDELSSVAELVPFDVSDWG